MHPDEKQISEVLKVILNLKLCLARNLLHTMDFHFGEILTDEDERVGGMHILSISCAWRLETKSALITGSDDFWVANDDIKNPKWRPSEDGGEGSYQFKALQNLWPRHPELDYFVNETDEFVVEEVHVSALATVQLQLTGGYRLSIFPSGARGEQWRLMTHKGAHFVVKNV